MREALPTVGGMSGTIPVQLLPGNVRNDQQVSEQCFSCPCLELLPGLPWMMDCKLWDEIDPFLPNLILVKVFRHSSKTLAFVPHRQYINVA